MNDSEIFDLGELFIASMGMLPRDIRWPFDNPTFARAVDEGTAAGNQFASKFYVTSVTTGRHCPDYERLLRTMLSAGLITYLSDAFIVNVGTHGAKALFRRLEATETQIKDAQEFLALFQKHAGISP